MLTARRWRSKQKNKRKKYGLKRSPKTHLFKNALQSRDFWNAGFPGVRLRLDRRKRRFSNTMMSYIKKRHLTSSLYNSVTHAQWGMLSYFHRFSNLVWTGENNSNTPRVDAFTFLFRKRRKNLRFQINLATCGRGLSWHLRAQTDLYLKGKSF